MEIHKIIERLDSIRDWITDNEGGSTFIDSGDLRDARREIDELKSELLNEQQENTETLEQHNNKALRIADVSEQSELLVLVCDYCGKEKPNNDNPCSCGKGDFWVVKEKNK